MSVVEFIADNVLRACLLVVFIASAAQRARSGTALVFMLSVLPEFFSITGEILGIQLVSDTRLSIYWLSVSQSLTCPHHNIGTF